jgi:hypothetical protein
MPDQAKGRGGKSTAPDIRDSAHVISGIVRYRGISSTVIPTSFHTKDSRFTVTFFMLTRLD